MMLVALSSTIISCFFFFTFLLMSDNNISVCGCPHKEKKLPEKSPILYGHISTLTISIALKINVESFVLFSKIQVYIGI